MSIGVVQEISKTDKGAPFLVIDAQRYYASRCDVSGVKPGDRIEYVFNEFGEQRNGKRARGLEKWRPVMDASGKPETASTVTEADILRSVSNVVGSACAAGVVKTPDELAAWFGAAYFGFMGMGNSAQTPANGPAHEFDDSAALAQDMPDKFYESLPPTKGVRW